MIRLIINIEAQNDFYPGYPLIKRGIYYCSRMISAQYGTEFKNSHYENIKKVYSIWTQTLESEMSLMCNLSKGVEEKGIEKGRQEGIIAMVSALKDLQIADSIILNKIQEKFHLAEETAKMYL